MYKHRVKCKVTPTDQQSHKEPIHERDDRSLKCVERRRRRKEKKKTNPETGTQEIEKLIQQQ